MKKLRIFTVALCAMALAMGGTSCNKEKENNIQSGDRMVIGAGINQGGDGQKTHLGENGDKVDILWSKGDSFMLYAGESTDGQTFTIKGEGGATTADFEGAAPGSAPYYAFYPSDGVTRNSEYEFTYTLPKEVEYETLPDHAGPMIGYSKDGSSAMFTAATPALYLSLTGDVKVSKVELIDKNNAFLNGVLLTTFNVINDEVTNISSYVGGGTDNTQTVTMKNGIQLSETPVVFSFPIPVGVFNGDNSAEIVVTYEGGSKTITGGITGGAQLGVAYGKAAEIKAPTAPAGALPGVFTVNESGKKVYFSKGNLWADGSNTLHFEDSQWESTPTSDDDMDASHVSHFTWSATVEAAVGTGNEGSYLFCNVSHKVSVNESDAIYYALSIDEWGYLFNNHSKKWVTVHGVNGYVIAPDGFAGTLADSYADDAALAADNLVFLPAAGSRFNSISVTGVGSYGHYWSSYRASRYTHYLFFSNDGVESSYDYNRYIGMSLRLVSEK